MFERFTDPARVVVVRAQDEARGLKHGYIGTEHLLLGLLREEEGLAARVLASLDVGIDEVRTRIAGIVGPGEEQVAGQIPFTPRSKKVLELSLREAISLGHNYIGTEHILLGLVREKEGVAARILGDLGADAEKVRDQVVRMLPYPGGVVPGPGRLELFQAQPRGRRWRRPRHWEYHLHEPGDDLEAELTSFGAEGWELVLRLDDGRLVLKRPRP